MKNLSCAVHTLCHPFVTIPLPRLHFQAFMKSPEMGILPQQCKAGASIAVLNCQKLPVHLPYLLLQWAQAQFKKKNQVDWSQKYKGVYFTEADNVLVMASGNGASGNGNNAVLSANGVHQFFAKRGKNCYLAPTRLEKRSSGNLVSQHHQCVCLTLFAFLSF